MILEEKLKIDTQYAQKYVDTKTVPQRHTLWFHEPN